MEREAEQIGNDLGGYIDRYQPRKMSYQTLKQRENAIRAKFARPWIKDDESKACFLCRKEFNFLYRRKHHCRKCGQMIVLLVSNRCSNYFLSKLVDPNSGQLDKDTRLCETCYVYCKEFLECQRENKVDDDGSDSSDNEMEESDQLKVLNRLEFGSVLETKLRSLITYVFQQEKKLSSIPRFGEQHTEKTFGFILYCLQNLRGRGRRLQGSEKKSEKFNEMDINRSVMIRTSLHKDNQFAFISGIISSKNVAKKNMCLQFGSKRNERQSAMQSRNVNESFESSSNNSKSNPYSNQQLSPSTHNTSNSHLQQQQPLVRVMAIQVSVDIFSHTDSNYPDLQQVIAKQKQYVTRIVDGIKQFKPQIIFCQENVHQDILASLEIAGITVVQKIKSHVIRKIAECSRCHLVQDIAILLPGQGNQRVQQSSHKHYVGTLQTAYFKTYSFAASQKTFMFLEQPERAPSHIVSLLITGSSIEILKQFKKSLQVILRLARHLFLEQEIIGMNNEMIKNNKKAKKLYMESLENEIVDCGNLNNFLDEKMGLQEFLYSDLAKFGYVRLQYKKADWEQFDGVTSREDLEKYILDKKVNIESSKLSTLVKYCGEFEHEQVSFYQVKDMSLAEFLMMIYFERNTACATCKRPMYNHYQLYVRQRSYVRFSITERMDPNLTKSTKPGNNQSNTQPNNGINGNKDANESKQQQFQAQQLDKQQMQQRLQQDKSGKYTRQSERLTPIRGLNAQNNNINGVPLPRRPLSNSNGKNNHSTSTPKGVMLSHSPNTAEISTMQRKRINPREPVSTYILCEHCHQTVSTTQQALLGRALADYSYNRFLQHMFQEFCENFKRERKNQLEEIIANQREERLTGKDERFNTMAANITGNTYTPNNLMTSQSIGNAAAAAVSPGMVPQKCVHAVKTRVFKIKDVEIKFQSGKTNLHTFQRVHFSSEPTQQAIKDADSEYYKEAFVMLKNLFKSQILDASTKLNKLVEIFSQKKTSKQQPMFQAVLEKSKLTQECIEAERDFILSNFDSSKISNYQSIMQLYILENRIHIGLARLHQLRKEAIKKKIKQFEKQHNDEAAAAPPQDLEISLLEDEMQETPTVDHARTLKEYQVTMNVHEEKNKDDDQAQPFEYIPVYAKNQLSMIAWALNTKHYGRYLKDAGLGKKVPRQYLLDTMKRKTTEQGIDEKQAIEENKIVVRMIKCHEMEMLRLFDPMFQGSHVIQEESGEAHEQSKLIQSSNNDLTLQDSSHNSTGGQVSIESTSQQNPPKTKKINNLTKDEALNEVENESPSSDGAIQDINTTAVNGADTSKQEIDDTNILKDITVMNELGTSLCNGENNILQPINENEDDASNNNNAESTDVNQDVKNEDDSNNTNTDKVNTSDVLQNIEIEDKDNSNGQGDQSVQQVVLQEEDDATQTGIVAVNGQQQAQDSEQQKISSNGKISIPQEKKQPIETATTTESGQTSNSTNTSPNHVNASGIDVSNKFRSQTTSALNQNLSTLFFKPAGNFNNNSSNTPTKTSSIPSTHTNEGQPYTLANQQMIQNNPLIYLRDPALISSLLNASGGEKSESKQLSQSQSQQGHQQPQQSNGNTPHAGQHSSGHRIAYQSLAVSSSNTSQMLNLSYQFTEANENRIQQLLMRGNEGVGEKLGELHIHFARQFEAFRNLHGISLERIIESLRTCQVVRLPGGQTQSVFVKSHDELFVVKGVSALEFGYFQQFTPDYLQHMANYQHSLLAKVFGMFELRFDGEKRYYVVMENLFYGIDKETSAAYDLKGSRKRRFTRGLDIGLDTNFMIDMNCEPFFIDNSTFQNFDKTLRNDSDFLAQQQIVDYSLLLIVEKNKRTLRLGIIDYFRKFDLQKFLEKQIKGLIYGGDPTIIEPRKYQERFVKTLTRKFFCKV